MTILISLLNLVILLLSVRSGLAQSGLVLIKYSELDVYPSP